MGFENRKSSRIKTSLPLYFWADGAAHGPGTWGQAINLSDSGMAFSTSKGAPKDELLLVEFSLPGIHKPFRLFAQVVSSQHHSSGAYPYEIRVKFFGLEGEELLQLRHHVLHTADPKAAAASGWGRAEFPGIPALELRYREIEQAEHKKLMEEKTFFSSKEAVYLKRFQEFLQQQLGAKAPGNFKIIGNRPLKEHALVWMEMILPKGQFHALGRALWTRHESGEKAEIGMGLEAYHKEEALKVEKSQ